ncbi:MAG: glycosyltransferase family 1 protein [Patescibacteria group bacterium]|nr:glycosyltransferase family 1 protein [Patescibacteria group bacterium]MDD4304441.1 glycosyltransferase family 1 protein [Patescibacteria group bacterium]MDD4695464.1 glycosyltransferase family 1 protein [Patescibacteria group bacterium]
MEDQNIKYRKIAIDVSALRQKNLSGVGKYLKNVLERLLLIDDKNEYFLFSFGHKNIPLNLNFQNKKNVHYIHKKISSKVFFLLNFLFHIPHLDILKFAGKKKKMDIIWLPNFNPCSLKYKKTKLITTIHDLSFVKYREFLNLKRKLWHDFLKIQKIVKRSNKLIAVSENTSMDLQNIYKVSKEKILVSPLGIDKKFCKIEDENLLKNVKLEYNLPDNFLLFVGVKEPRKNILSIIKAFSKLKNEDVYLVIVGSCGWKEKSWRKFYNNLSDTIKSRIIIVDYVSDEDLPAFYNLAKIFIWPSFYEGFGLPPIEALACSCPVIVSNNSSLPEILKNNAILIEAFNIENLYVVINELLTDENLYNFYKSKTIAEEFYNNWDKSAQKILNLFNKL